MRRLLAAAIAATLAICSWAQEMPRSRPAPGAKTYVGVFNFAGTLGEDIAERVRIRLGKHDEYEVLDRFTVADVAASVPAQTRREKVVDLMDNQLGCQVAVYGTVTQQGATVTAEVRCVDRRDRNNPVEWAETFSDGTERAAPLIARKIVEKLRGQAEWTPPQYGDEEEPKDLATGKPLNVNGGFEKGHAGWEPPDNVATFLIDGPTGRGKVLRVRTDLQRQPWLAYRRALLAGEAEPSRPPKVGRDTSFGSVAGMEGVHFRGDWIVATPGRRYWLTADCKGQGGAKVFVKGFTDWTARADGLPESSLARLGITAEQFAGTSEEKRKALIAEDARRHPELYRREVYRWYLNCKDATRQWKHLSAPFPPRGGLPANVQWLQIQIYSYWPPGEYLWDNVHLYKDPRQKAPLPEEKPRTPNVGRTSDVVEEEMRQERQRKKNGPAQDEEK